MVAAQVLHWTRDWRRAQELAWRVAVLYAELFQQLQDATLGVAQWLAALRKANTPCALVSHMPAAHVKVRPREAIVHLPHACCLRALTPALLLHCTQHWCRKHPTCPVCADRYSPYDEPWQIDRGLVAQLESMRLACFGSHVMVALRASRQDALERMGLAEYFSARVTAEDDMDTLAERLLSASLKLQRPPDHCVVFVASPSAVTAAHNCTMKVRLCCLYRSIGCSHTGSAAPPSASAERAIACTESMLWSAYGWST